MTPMLAILLACAALPAAGEPRLGLLIDCTLGEDCFVLNHVDHDPGPGAEDFTCGPFACDGHEGTDFALPSLAAMRSGVVVRAAAAGVVRATRDGMPGLGLHATPADLLAGKECGNGVVIDHGGGWETQIATCATATGWLAGRDRPVRHRRRTHLGGG